MQKAWNIVSVVLIAGLGVWIFFLLKANSEWKKMLAKKLDILVTPVTPTPDENRVTSVTGEQFWESIKKKITDMTIDIKLNNNQ